jgi:hypothetical protein
MSASSKNSFKRDSNFKSNNKPFKPTKDFDKTFTDDKPVENAPTPKKGNVSQEEHDEMLVQRL